MTGSFLIYIVLFQFIFNFSTPQYIPVPISDDEDEDDEYYDDEEENDEEEDDYYEVREY